MSWLIFAILAATSFGFYNFFIKISADKLSPTIALMLIAGTAFVVAMISTIFLKLTGQNLIFSKNVIYYPILAGLFTGVAEIFYLSMYSKNAPVSVGTPIVVGGTILVAVVLGIFLLKEPLNIEKVSGVILLLIGLVVLSRG